MRFEFFQLVKFSYFYSMNLRHKLFLLTMSFVVLFTNIGLNVYTHWCEEDGAFVSYIVPSDDHCGEEKEIAVLPSCCQQEKQSSCSSIPQIQNEDCCSDDFSWIKLTVDQDNSLKETVKEKSQHYQYLTFTSRSQIHSVFKLDHVVYCNVDPPPSPKGRDILILNQVFRL